MLSLDNDMPNSLPILSTQTVLPIGDYDATSPSIRDEHVRQFSLTGSLILREFHHPQYQPRSKFVNQRIILISTNGSPGANLEDALNGNLVGLDNPEQVVYAPTGQKESYLIHVRKISNLR